MSERENPWRIGGLASTRVNRLVEGSAAKDRDDADFLFRSQKLDAEVLRD
jgi:hypothetical protein